METICLQCGDRGFTNAFVYCVKCLDVAVHRYCLDVIPETFDEFVHWVCDDCEVEVQNQSRTRNKNVNGFSGVRTNEDEVVDAQRKNHVYKDGLPQSSDACTNHDLVEQDESSSDFPLIQLAGMKDKNKKAKDNRMQHDKLSNDTLERDKNKKRSITESNKSYEDRVKVNVIESARLASDSTLATKLNQNKGLESRDQKCMSLKPFDSDSNPHMAEHRIVLCNQSSESSKTKKRTEGLNLEYLCADMNADGRNFDPSNDHIENKESEYRSYIGFSNNLVISSAEPVLMPIWRGSFDIWNKEQDILDGLMAHLSSKACQKVYDAACEFQPVLRLEMLPKSNVWPKSFETSEPSGDNIALYFFPSKISERVFDDLVEKMMGEELALKAIMKNAELLIFTSTELPLLYWRFQGKHYLWGVFRGKQSPPLQSNSCAMELVHNPTMQADSSNRIHVKTKRCGDQSPVSPLSKASSYGSGAC
ncbi:hypothetical protein CDL12_24451 [Handroanthus impetiginosus]|uniref:AIPP2-like SPOC-like domain-containing protein n=1 Tax=Handroanthus impetiginosus TaxID=429701 RepID=A0A2G9GCK0_9LAMI|nr:hypothetical protein CDL12_24451 [Handroanthus impetiginosus]